MNRRFWVLAACVIVVVAVFLVAASLSSLRLEAADAPAFKLETDRTSLLTLTSLAAETPVWRILLLWFLVALGLVLGVLILPAQLRRRILRQVTSYALGVLLFVLALHYHLLELPEGILDPPAEAPLTELTSPSTADVQAFQPPLLAPWMTLVISVIFLWLAIVALYFIYRRWRSRMAMRRPALDRIADIARTSLTELAGGREWSDVIVDAYARMSEAVRISRGVQREISATPREFSSRLARMGLPATAIQELTRLFESVRYGRHAPDAQSRQRAVACLDSILQACRVS